MIDFFVIRKESGFLQAIFFTLSLRSEEMLPEKY